MNIYRISREFCRFNSLIKNLHEQDIQDMCKRVKEINQCSLNITNSINLHDSTKNVSKKYYKKCYKSLKLLNDRLSNECKTLY